MQFYQVLTTLGLKSVLVQCVLALIQDVEPFMCLIQSVRHILVILKSIRHILYKLEDAQYAQPTTLFSDLSFTSDFSLVVSVHFPHTREQDLSCFSSSVSICFKICTHPFLISSLGYCFALAIPSACNLFGWSGWTVFTGWY